MIVTEQGPESHPGRHNEHDPRTTPDTFHGIVLRRQVFCPLTASVFLPADDYIANTMPARNTIAVLLRVLR
jgi:hypothetical protein